MRARVLAGLVLLTVLSASPSRAGTTYTYDQLGRVATATYDSGLQIVYSYDQAGNRTQVVTQTGTNRPPQANNDWVSLAENTPLTFDPRVNDTDPDGDALTITAVGIPVHGTATKTSTSVTYTPTTAYSGTDSFGYTISDSHGSTASATVYTTVTALPPIAINDTASTTQNTPVTFDPRLNDSDPSASTLTVTSVTTPSHGTAAVTGSGTTVTYTPASGYAGPDGFGYTISDAHGLTASASVIVTVNAPPTAVADFTPVPTTAAVTFNPRANDSDPNSLALTIVSTTTPAHGAVAINGGLSLTYTPTSGYSGFDTFNYTIANTLGETASATDTMCVIAVTPTAVNDSQLIAISHASHTSVTPQTNVGPLANDSDPCHLPLSIASVTQGAKGSVVIDPSGTFLTYTYNTVVLGSLETTDSFTYTAINTVGATATATVTITIDVEFNN
jgi:YD repeat-containing protein